MKAAAIVHRRKNEDLSKAVAAEQIRQGGRASEDTGEIKITGTIDVKKFSTGAWSGGGMKENDKPRSHMLSEKFCSQFMDAVHTHSLPEMSFLP